MAGAFPEREFGPLRSQSRLAKIADAKKTDYWGGSTWVYYSDITNDSDGSGTIEVTATPGEDNEMELLYASVLNFDVTNRTATVRLRDADDNELARVFRGVLNTGASSTFPSGGFSTTNAIGWAGNRYIISGEMDLSIQLGAMAVSKRMSTGIVCRVRGDKPTTTESGQGTSPAITIKTNRFF